MIHCREYYKTSCVSWDTIMMSHISGNIIMASRVFVNTIMMSRFLEILLCNGFGQYYYDIIDLGG